MVDQHNIASAHGGLPAPGLATQLLHRDDVDHLAHPNHPIAPTLTTSTTFRAPHPDSAAAAHMRSAVAGEVDFDFQDPPTHVYSRYSQDTNLRAEKVLSSLLRGHALTYASGLNAAYAALLFYSPSVVAIRNGYHGVHASLKLYSRGRDVKVIDLDAEYPRFAPEKQRDGGLLVWVETPLNPTGEARDLSLYSERTRAAGGSLVVDSTFAPPPLTDPFAFGADMVMHSGTKYFGGHSDVLCGVLAVKDKADWDALWHDRTYLGSTLGSLEAYLLLRSLRTLTLRVQRQSETATKLAQWLHSLSLPSKSSDTSSGDTGEQQSPPPSSSSSTSPSSISGGKVIGRTWHGSLQPRQDTDLDPLAKSEGLGFDPRQQMPGGWSPTFAFRTTKPEYARMLPHLLRYFTPATSLGGVESLMEHRIVSDPGEDARLIRVSVGLEDFEDLRADIAQGLETLLKAEQEQQRQL
ncbi:uncharacterized protein PFL1_03865 [Pseudozyma flocculosa PF-1]|uniref:Related to Cystathionine beta-lyase n=2 Tax=Pseudozyma flocculosa TaxID=84751 RepID=A0A5C3EXK3_9BASI|nr:uncharacterized protein PFL1_03865 [Pseudozyma flocculosa PF-1]EPQ28561.1 hypothetical protein PFL1_03865 [Pseudozyma flocculosa PF-1]SPO36495.1 related to Cystathionine beta-lyase [Pseudozyma flocculosa]